MVSTQSISRRHEHVMSQRGFTLIEMLVVISIISLLASVVLAALNSARIKAQDAHRIQDLAQLRTALTLYYDDHGSYPIIPGGGYAEISSVDEKWNTDENVLYQALVNGSRQYIPKLPMDPRNGPGDQSWHVGGYVYTYSTYSVPGGPPLGSDYDLTAQLETDSPLACPNKQSPIHTDPNDTWCNYPLDIDYIAAGVPVSERFRRIFSDH